MACSPINNDSPSRLTLQSILVAWAKHVSHGDAARRSFGARRSGDRPGTAGIIDIEVSGATAVSELVGTPT
jgi:hypothetical protein